MYVDETVIVGERGGQGGVALTYNSGQATDEMNN